MAVGLIVVDQELFYLRFKVLTVASMKFRFVFWDVLQVDNYFTRQYIPEDKSELFYCLLFYVYYCRECMGKI
jgi:hypothetical protein